MGRLFSRVHQPTIFHAYYTPLFWVVWLSLEVVALSENEWLKIQVSILLKSDNKLYFTDYYP